MSPPTKALLTTLANRLISATPLPADVELWTIQSARCICDQWDTFCEWSFTISTNMASFAPVACSISVRMDFIHGVPASQSNTHNVPCGPYNISAAWSGTFGENKGFTTLTVVDVASKKVVFPTYADHQVAGGQVVVPDLQLPPRPL